MILWWLIGSVDIASSLDQSHEYVERNTNTGESFSLDSVLIEWMKSAVRSAEASGGAESNRLDISSSVSSQGQLKNSMLPCTFVCVYIFFWLFLFCFLFSGLNLFLLKYSIFSSNSPFFLHSLFQIYSIDRILLEEYVKEMNPLYSFSSGAQLKDYG